MHFLFFFSDLLLIEKTSSGKHREKTKCPINRVKIGHVPDRGGRAYEHEVPPPEMPAFMQRQSQPQQQRHQGGTVYSSVNVECYLCVIDCVHVFGVIMVVLG